MDNYRVLYDSTKENDKAYSVIKDGDFSGDLCTVYLSNLEKGQAENIMYALNAQEARRHEQF